MLLRPLKNTHSCAFCSYWLCRAISPDHVHTVSQYTLYIGTMLCKNAISSIHTVRAYELNVLETLKARSPHGLPVHSLHIGSSQVHKICSQHQASPRVWQSLLVLDVNHSHFFRMLTDIARRTTCSIQEHNAHIMLLISALKWNMFCYEMMGSRYWHLAISGRMHVED